jgi:transcriptional regulator with XRE-family HTH domain
LSRAELAVAVGVSVETIGAIERNQHSPGSVTLARISTILQTPIDTFFTSDEEITA